MQTRKEQFEHFFPDAPSYRWRQVLSALFDVKNQRWEMATTIPKEMREVLSKEMLWSTIGLEKLYTSERKDTFKAILKSSDNKYFESVLMANKRGQWTICVSSQIGCAMRCTFCATGTMGLTRSLVSDEIIDQYRFWKFFLQSRPALVQRISNVVFMGMGEPMANYENVKQAIHAWLAHTDLGPTHITVSTVGILPQLEKILTDKDWPPVRIAISLHSANPKRRAEIVPTTVADFLPKLADWSKRYAKILGNRRHHITYEYTALSGVNDTPEHAKELAQYIRKTGVSKINVIPYNSVKGKPFARSDQSRITAFKEILLAHGIEVTQRKTMGDDIDAACGQLATVVQ